MYSRVLASLLHIKAPNQHITLRLFGQLSQSFVDTRKSQNSLLKMNDAHDTFLNMWTSTRALVDGARSAQPTKCNKKSNSLYRNNRHMTSLPLNFGHLLVLCASLLWTCDEPTLIVWPFQPLRIDCSTNKMQQDHVQKLCQHKQSLNSLCWSCWQVCAPILCESCKRGMRILRLVHMGSQAPSPTHVSKSQHEGTISTLSLKTVLQYGWLSSKSDLDYSMQEDNWKTCVQSLIEQKDFASKKCCHVGVQVILETKVWSGKSQFPCSQRLRLHILTSSDLGLGTPCAWPDPHFITFASLN